MKDPYKDYLLRHDPRRPFDFFVVGSFQTPGQSFWPVGSLPSTYMVVWETTFLFIFNFLLELRTPETLISYSSIHSPKRKYVLANFPRRLIRPSLFLSPLFYRYRASFSVQDLLLDPYPNLKQRICNRHSLHSLWSLKSILFSLSSQNRLIDLLVQLLIFKLSAPLSFVNA